MSGSERRKLVQAVRYVKAGQESRLEFFLEDPRRRIFQSTAPFEIGFGGATVRFPEGERWNLGSVPRLAWRVIAPHELGAEPTFVHDKLYEYEGALPREWFLSEYRTFTRPEADADGLRDLALRYNAREWQALLAYRILRMTWTIPDALGITTWKKR